MQDPQNRQKFAIWAPSHNFVGLCLRNCGKYRPSEKIVKLQYLSHMSSQYGELRPTNGWDRFVSLGLPSKFQRVSSLGSITARHSSSGRQPNFAALNRGRHLYSAGRLWRWVLAHILVCLTEGTTSHHCNLMLLRFAWVVDDAKCIVVTRVCVSVPWRLPALLHAPGCKLGNRRGCPLVLHYCADLQSVHGFRCYDNIVPNAKCQRVFCTRYMPGLDSAVSDLELRNSLPTQSVAVQSSLAVLKRSLKTRLFTQCFYSSCV